MLSFLANSIINIRIYQVFELAKGIVNDYLSNSICFGFYLMSFMTFWVISSPPEITIPVGNTKL